MTAALLYCQVLCGLVNAAVAAWSVLTWSGVSGATLALRLPADRVALRLVVVTVPLTVATGLSFMYWLYLAASNCQRRDCVLRHTPGWAFGSWFVPILSLWRPKQIVDDVWRASVPAVPPGLDLAQVPKSLLTMAWWSAWLLAGVLPAVGMSKALYAAMAPNIDAIRHGSSAIVVVDAARLHETVSLWGLWSAVLFVLAAGLGAVVVTRITGWQRLAMAADAGM